MRPLTALIAVCAIATAVSTARAQDQTNTDKFVSKEDYLKLKEDHGKLKQELDALKSQMQEFLKKTAPPESEAVKAQLQDLQKKAAAQQAETDQALDDLDKQVQAAKQMAKNSFPGATKMLLAGYGSATFTSTTTGYGPSQPPAETPAPDDRPWHNFFTATFNPIFLWKVSDRLLFEGEIEVELGGTEASFALEMAHLSYIANDYLTVSAGKFLNPMDYFVERQHMAWVNKLPDKPLAVYDGLLPEAEVGLQVRGAIPVGQTKVGYALYAANAPELNVDPNSIGATDLGTLEFNNFDNAGKHVAIGGRLGFLPIPEFEIGYGLQYSDVAPPGNGGSVKALLQSADMSYVRESTVLKGIINLKAQWVWSHIDKFTYVPGATVGGSLPFQN